MEPFVPGAPAPRMTSPALRSVQRAAAERLVGASLPSWEEEDWRYSPIDDLDLAHFEPADGAVSDLGPEGDPILRWEDQLGHRVSAVVECIDGRIMTMRGEHVWRGSQEATVGLIGSVLGDAGDVFSTLNAAYGLDPVVIKVPRNVVIAHPIVVVNTMTTDGLAVFPRLVIDAGENSEVNIVDLYRSNDVEALVAPVVEVRCGPAARVGYATEQNLGGRVWQIGTQASTVGSQGTFRSSMAAFGGLYARMRSDCRLIGSGAHGDLDAIYFGGGEQVLDFRTFQHHAAPHTTSNLLFKGVVDDESRAIYTGLIKVSEEGRGTEAFQTNRNLKLSENAWAESVPNLEIETNDVRCSHASTVGPIDEEQRFYLESRGVPTAEADHLIVSGFFDEVIRDLPVAGLESTIRERIEQKLEAAGV